jgi:hypothetical protein
VAEEKSRDGEKPRRLNGEDSQNEMKIARTTAIGTPKTPDLEKSIEREQAVHTRSKNQFSIAIQNSTTINSRMSPPSLPHF